MEDTKKTTIEANLLKQLFNLLDKHEKAFKQTRTFNRVKALVMAELFSFARHTITQLILSLGVGEDDWSAWYRLFSEKRFEEKKVAEVMVKEMMAEFGEDSHMVTGIDGFPVPRSSQKMPGTSWFKGLRTARFKAGIQRVQRFVQGAWLTPVENGYSRAIPLRCLPAFPPKAQPSQAARCKEWEAGLQYLDWLRQELDKNGQGQRRILTLADGSYDTIAFWAEKPDRTDIIVRTPRNRCLYYLLEADAHGNCKYGEKVPAPHTFLRKRKPFKFAHVLVRGREKRMRYRVIGPVVRDLLPHIPMFLIVIGGGKRPQGSRRKSYKPCFFLVSAVKHNGQWQLPLPITQLLAWLWQRWELEVAHREMKAGFGLGDKQCWHPRSAISSVQWSLWVYSLLLLSGYRAWGVTGGHQPLGRWRKSSGRWSFNTLWRAFRQELWHCADFQASWHRSADNWLRKEPLLAALNNSILAASRA